MIRFKITTALLDAITQDLARPHAHAHERVGFVHGGLSLISHCVTILAHDYYPVADEDYLCDPSVGAMIGPDALGKAMSAAFDDKIAIFHIHAHGGHGVPRFSAVDQRESRKFVPDFFKVRPERPHGAIVLSRTHAFGHAWLQRDRAPCPIDEFQVVGPHFRKWSTV